MTGWQNVTFWGLVYLKGCIKQSRGLFCTFEEMGGNDKDAFFRSEALIDAGFFHLITPSPCHPVTFREV